jgi:hypothetical protein
MPVASPGGGAVYGPGAADAGNLLGAGGALTTLYFDPPTFTLQVTGTPLPTATFTLRNGAGGAAVTPDSLMFDRPDLASLPASPPPGGAVVLTAAGFAGTGTLQGVYHGHVASAKLTVSAHVAIANGGIDPAARASLDGASAPDTQVTSLLYPYDATVFPLGIDSPLVMWKAPNTGDVYRLRLQEKNFIYDTYEVVPEPARMAIDQAWWDRLTVSNQGEPVQVTLSRWDAASQTAYVAAQEKWTIAHASLRGAVYYWSTTDADGHMSRLFPGSGAQPEVLPTGVQGTTCMGCHAVSADGSTLVADVGDYGCGEDTTLSPAGPNQADNRIDQREWFSYNLPAVTVRAASRMFGGNVALTSDGKYVAFGDETLYLADTAAAQLYPRTGLDNFALDTGMTGLMMPVFSPESPSSLFFAAIEGAGPDYISLKGGKIVLFDFDESTRMFSNPRGLASASSFPVGQQAIGYPTFSPDSKWLAFHVGDKVTGCEESCLSDETQRGGVYMQSASGAAPIRLTTLNDASLSAADVNHTFEPTFCPIARGGYFWLVVSSSRDWGNRIMGTPANGKKRLWVAAVDANPGGGDPSHPPFFLQGQEDNAENLRGFWALAACIPTQSGGGCKAGFECCSGFCDQGVCVERGHPVCAAIGDACMNDADCCNAPIVRCNGGKCTSANM